MEKECTVIINNNGMDVRYGDIRIQGLGDILLKKSPNEVGESLKEYIASRKEGVETIRTENVDKIIEDSKEENTDNVIEDKSAENNSDTSNKKNK